MGGNKTSPHMPPPPQPPQGQPRGAPRQRRAPAGVRVSLCVKYTIFSFNIIFWICGTAILGFGIWGLFAKSADTVSAIAEDVGLKIDPMYSFIIVGGLIFILALLGCIGSIRENTCLIKLYMVIIVLLLLAEITIGILIYFYQDRFSTLVDVWVEKTLINYFDDPDSQFLMDNMQEGLQCCGVTAPGDWEMNVYFNCSSIAHSKCSVPFSCCLPDPADMTGVVNYQCGYGVLEESPANWYQTIYTTGCATALKDWFITNAILIGCIGAVVILLQFFAIILAKSLIGDINEVKSFW